PLANRLKHAQGCELAVEINPILAVAMDRPLDQEFRRRRFHSHYRQPLPYPWQVPRVEVAFDDRFFSALPDDVEACTPTQQKRNGFEHDRLASARLAREDVKTCGKRDLGI